MRKIRESKKKCQDSKNKKGVTVQTESTIQRCPHDKENPYVMINRSLIRDESLSFECRMLIILFLSFREGWKFSIPMLMKQQKLSKDRMYRILDEAMEGGYIKREEEVIAHPKNKNLNLTHYTYYVSETGKFKKCFRRPENQDDGNSSQCPEGLKEFFPCPDSQDPEKQDTKDTSILSLIDNNEDKKEQPPIPPKGEDANASVSENKVFFFYGEHKNCKLTLEQLDKLKKKFGEQLTEEWIETIDLEAEKQGLKKFNTKYRNHYATILSWSKLEKKKSKTYTFQGKYPDRRQRNADGSVAENPYAGVF